MALGLLRCDWVSCYNLGLLPRLIIAPPLTIIPGQWPQCQIFAIYNIAAILMLNNEICSKEEKNIGMEIMRGPFVNKDPQFVKWPETHVMNILWVNKKLLESRRNSRLLLSTEQLVAPKNNINSIIRVMSLSEGWLFSSEMYFK